MILCPPVNGRRLPLRELTIKERYSVEFAVVLVEPLYEGNVGAVARSMSNFGIKRLILVSPCELGDEAKRRAKHGSHLLDSAQLHDDLDSAINQLDFCAATTGIRTEDPRKHTRQHTTPEELCHILEPQLERDITIGLVFGRENYGLYNDELKKCDLVVSIPTAEDYPILNLSHAVTILCYELFTSLLPKTGTFTSEGAVTSGQVSDGQGDGGAFFLAGLMKKFTTVLELIECPGHRTEITKVALRRILGRALITEWEYHRLMGFLSMTERCLKE